MVEGLKQQSDLALAALTHEDMSDLSTLSNDDVEKKKERSVLRYRRFDVMLDALTLKRIGLPELADDLKSIIRMDSLDHINSNLEIGRHAGECDLNDDLFSMSFDIRPKPGNAGG